MFIGTVASAQNFSQNSLQSGLSAGLFDNELGAALSVIEDGRGPGFSDLDMRYLFAGLGNLNRATATGVTAGSIANPLLLGLYLPDPELSVFTGTHLAGNRDVTETVVETPGANKVIDGDTFRWIAQRTTTEVVTGEILRLENQVVTTMAGMNVGLYVDFMRPTPHTRTTTIEENYFDAEAADPDEEPDVEHSYTETDVQTTGGLFTIDLAVPVFISGNGMGHYINPRLSYTRNAGASTSQTTEYDFDALADGAPDVNETEVEDQTTDVRTQFDIGGDYALLLPGIVNSERNRLRFDGSLDATFYGRTFSVDDRNTDLTFDGDDVEEGDTTTTTTETDQQGATDFGITAGVLHSLYFPVGPGMDFAFAPGLNLGFSSAVDGVLTRPTRNTTETETVDADGDQTAHAFTETTTEYAAWDRDNTISATFRLPVAFMAHPEDWIFGFTISSTPTIAYTRTTEVRYNETRASQTVETRDDVAETETETTTTFAEKEPARSVRHAWAFTAPHRLGINVPLGEHINFDIALGAGVAGSLFHFNNMTVQATIGF